MTNEQRREYMKLWRKSNRDRIKEVQRDNARRKALAALESVKQLDGGIFIVKTIEGREYVVGGCRQCRT